MDYFIAKFEKDGLTQCYRFRKSAFNEQSAERWLKDKNIENFFLIFEPEKPQELKDGSVFMSGFIGFDITLETMLPYLKESKEIILDTPGGSLLEAYRIHDGIQHMDSNPKIGVIGMCASAGTLIPLAVGENSWGSANSIYLIHKPRLMDAGDDEYMANAAKELKMHTNILARLYAKASGKTTAEILDIMKEDRFIDAKTAKQLNLIAHVKRNINPKNVKMEELEKKLDSFGDKIVNSVKEIFTKKEEPEAVILARAEAAETKCSQLEGLTEQLETKCSELEGLTEQLETKNSDLTAKVGELETENAELKKQIEKYTADADEVKGLINDLKELKSAVTMEGRKKSVGAIDNKGVDRERVKKLLNEIEEGK